MAHTVYKEGESMIHVVLYEPEIPQNTGNIMRTCSAFGICLHLIEPLGFYMDDKHLKRAGMDYIKDLQWDIWHDWPSFIQSHQGAMYYVTRYGSHRPDSFDYRKDQADGKDIYLVFGKESTGIDKQILRENLDHCIRNPMVPNARSLNLANCVALMVYAVEEQLDFPGCSQTEVIKGADFLEKHSDGQHHSGWL